VPEAGISGTVMLPIWSDMVDGIRV
jgi:hypothetical protein